MTLLFLIIVLAGGVLIWLLSKLLPRTLSTILLVTLFVYTYKTIGNSVHPLTAVIVIGIFFYGIIGLISDLLELKNNSKKLKEF